MLVIRIMQMFKKKIFYRAIHVFTPFIHATSPYSPLQNEAALQYAVKLQKLGEVPTGLTENGLSVTRIRVKQVLNHLYFTASKINDLC